MIMSAIANTTTQTTPIQAGYYVGGLFGVGLLIWLIQRWYKSKKREDALAGVSSDPNLQLAVQAHNAMNPSNIDLLINFDGTKESVLYNVAVHCQNYEKLQKAYTDLYNRSLSADVYRELGDAKYLIFQQNIYAANPNNPSPVQPPNSSGVYELTALVDISVYNYPFDGSIIGKQQKGNYIGLSRLETINVKHSSGNNIPCYVVEYPYYLGFFKKKGIVQKSLVRTQY